MYREEVNIAYLCITISIRGLRTKVLHGTTSHSGHCPGQESHYVSLSLSKKPTKPSQQKAHQGSGGGHVQLVSLLSEIVDEFESD